MRALIVLWFALNMLVAGVCAAEAQLIDGPQGSVGGLFGGRRAVDPNRNTQSFDVNFDLAGGYDRDPNVLLLDSTSDLPDLTQWYASTASASARYRVTSNRRTIDARGRGTFNYQSNTADSLIGGEGVVSGTARFGRRRLNQLSLEFESSNQPGWIFGAFGPSLGPGPDDPAIGVAPPQGIVEQRWLVLAGTVGYEHHWNTRHVTALQYNNRRVHPIDGGGDDADWQTFVLDQRWAARPGVDVVGAYRQDENRQGDGNGELPPIRYQTLDMGLRLEKRFSSVRRYSVTIRAGSTRLSGSLHPSLTASAEFATSRYWGLSAEVSRGVMVLAGISPIPVLNDNVGVTFNGTPTRRLRYSLFASFARAGSVPSDPNLDNVTDVAGATGEFRYAVARWSAVFASYAFYHHRIQDEFLVSSGFPTRYDRHSVRIGMTFWMPLYGAF